MAALNEQAVSEQYQQRAKYREAERRQVESRHNGHTEELPSNEAAEQCTHDAERSRDQATAGIFAGHDEFGDAACEEAEQHLREDIPHAEKVTPRALRVKDGARG